MKATPGMVGSYLIDDKGIWMESPRMFRAAVDLLGYGEAWFLRFGRDRQNNTLTCLQNSRILFPRTSITKHLPGRMPLAELQGTAFGPPFLGLSPLKSCIGPSKGLIFCFKTRFHRKHMHWYGSFSFETIFLLHVNRDNFYLCTPLLAKVVESSAVYCKISDREYP